MSNFLAEAFDSDTEEGGGSFELLPPGDYVAQVTEAASSEMKSGAGHLLNLRWQILEGEYENRLVFQNVTYIHRTSETAQSIGRKTIKDLCDAIGVSGAVTDTSVLCFTPCRIRLGIERDKSGQYPDKNRVMRIMPLGEAPEPPAPAAKPAAKPAAATKPATTAAGVPWRR